jgi:hypothetical protein
MRPLFWHELSWNERTESFMPKINLEEEVALGANRSRIEEQGS